MAIEVLHNKNAKSSNVSGKIPKNGNYRTILKPKLLKQELKYTMKEN